MYVESKHLLPIVKISSIDLKTQTTSIAIFVTKLKITSTSSDNNVGSEVLCFWVPFINICAIV